MKEICVLFGGKSTEYDVSLRSVLFVLSVLEKLPYRIHKIGITRNGKWLLFKGENSEIAEDKWHENPKNEPICVDFSQKMLFTDSERLYPDVAFPVMHGEYGEDGRIQGVLELLEIPVIGVDSFSASLCMDKEKCKIIAQSSAIPVTPYVALRKNGEDNEKIIGMIKTDIRRGVDVFVKPSRGGSSVGISHVKHESELDSAVKTAFSLCDTVLIERAINGHECEVAILETGSALTVSEVGKISYTGDFYDYDEKYKSTNVKYEIPAQITDKSRTLCQKYAKEIFLLLGCRSMARVDFFVTEQGQVYFNEINAIPGFTSISMYPMLISHEKITPSELMTRLVRNAIR
ncbi:MAG: D-alanine--D-alanine ligase [Clostridia bacterium]|nr:D-alanine--D-alanine ligase [Clostridia bacterium]